LKPDARSSIEYQESWMLSRRFSLTQDVDPKSKRDISLTRKEDLGSGSTLTEKCTEEFGGQR